MTSRATSSPLRHPARRRATIGTLLLCLLAVSSFGACRAVSSPERGAPTRPNIVVLLVDDLGWQDVSVPLHTERTPLNDRYRTPHLERLAERGTRFTQAYAAAPVCTPTRTSYLTGRSPARNRITYWTLHRDRDTSAPFPGVRAPDWNVNGLSEDDPTFVRLLSDAGYRTIHVGKAHFGAKGTSGADPTRLGFDVNVAGHAAGAPGSYLGAERFSASARGGNAVWDVPGLEDYHDEPVYLTEVLAQEACGAIRDAVADGQPFFLNFAPYAIHTPLMANPRYLEEYGELHPTEATYATMIASVDAALGALVDELEAAGVLDDTIIVFTSDNGGLAAHGRGGEPHTQNAPLRSGKGSAYEGGVRVPQVIAWPGVTSGGRCDAPVITMDLFPTILAWAGLEATIGAHGDAFSEPRDGDSLVPLLRGEGAPAFEKRALTWHQPHFWGVQGPGIFPYTAIRAGDWKLVYRHADRGVELYELGSDLGEERELSAAHPGVVDDLAERLSRWCESVGAQMSIDEATGAPVPLPRDRAD